MKLNLLKNLKDIVVNSIVILISFILRGIWKKPLNS